MIFVLAIKKNIFIENEFTSREGVGLWSLLKALFFLWGKHTLITFPVWGGLLRDADISRLLWMHIISGTVNTKKTLSLSISSLPIPHCHSQTHSLSSLNWERRTNYKGIFCVCQCLECLRCLKCILLNLSFTCFLWLYIYRVLRIIILFHMIILKNWGIKQS